MEEQKYYIISKKHMQRNKQNLLLWGINDIAGKLNDREEQLK